MDKLNCNLKDIFKIFKSQNGSFAVGARDFAGWVMVLGFLFTYATWKLAWAENLMTSILSVIILVGAAISVTACPISQIRFRDQPRNDHLWAQYHVKK
jgi:hypothetical protein